MSKSLYTVRGFNAFQEGVSIVNANPKFNSFGVMEQFQTFEEKTVSNQADAIVEMLRGAFGSTFSTRNLVAMPSMTFGGPPIAGLPNAIDVRADKSQPIEEVVIVDIQVDLAVYSKSSLNDFRAEVNETFMRWAEKSRVRGSRGWRLSAVKTPKFEKNDSGSYTLRTQVILGSAVFYDQSTVKIGTDPATVATDLGNLKHQLKKVLPGLITEIRYNHSVLGKGTL